MPRATKNSSSPVVTESAVDAISEERIAESGLSEEGKTILSLLSEKLDAIVCRMDAKDAKLATLTEDNAKLKARISSLEERLESLESSNRRNNMILSGNELSRVSSEVDLKQTVVDLLRGKLKNGVPLSNILSAHRLGAKPSSQSPDGRNILVRFVDHEAKRDVLMACKKVQPPNLFANDDLTPVGNSIYYALRQAKKKFPTKVGGSGSNNGRVFAFVSSPNSSSGIVGSPNSSNGKVKIFFNTIQKVDEFFNRELGVSYGELVEFRANK